MSARFTPVPKFSNGRSDVSVKLQSRLPAPPGQLSSRPNGKGQCCQRKPVPKSKRASAKIKRVRQRGAHCPFQHGSIADSHKVYYGIKMVDVSLDAPKRIFVSRIPAKPLKLSMELFLIRSGLEAPLAACRSPRPHPSRRLPIRRTVRSRRRTGPSAGSFPGLPGLHHGPECLIGTLLSLIGFGGFGGF